MIKSWFIFFIKLDLAFSKNVEINEDVQPNIVKLLALALTNLVLSLVNLVTNLAKPSLGQPSY